MRKEDVTVTRLASYSIIHSRTCEDKTQTLTRFHLEISTVPVDEIIHYPACVVPQTFVNGPLFNRSKISPINHLQLKERQSWNVLSRALNCPLAFEPMIPPTRPPTSVSSLPLTFLAAVCRSQDAVFARSHCPSAHERLTAAGPEASSEGFGLGDRAVMMQSKGESSSGSIGASEVKETTMFEDGVLWDSVTTQVRKLWRFDEVSEERRPKSRKEGAGKLCDWAENEHLTTMSGQHWKRIKQNWLLS